MVKLFEIPEDWQLSEHQEIVIGSLLDNPGEYISAAEFCDALYGEECPGPAPAKLRVLIQRCRQIIFGISNGRAKIESRRFKGWRITKKDRMILKKMVM